MKRQTRTAIVEATVTKTHRRYGWTALFLWLIFGYLLEAFQGFKTAAYLLDTVRRELWTLAHFHGVALALVNLIYVQWAENPQLSLAQRQWASRALIVGSILMPLGFFLGGLVHYEGDPGLGIFLAPPGALLILITVGLQTLVAWRETN